MIDIHTHVLPGLDDGSTNIEESIDILKELISQGVKEIIATPHIISGVYDNNRKIIDEKIEELNSEITTHNLPIKIHKGAELYYEPNIIEKTKKEKLSLAGSKYILIETDLHRFPNNFEKVLYQFQVEGFFPIIAHAERFIPFINNFNLLLDIVNRGILIQMNCSSLLGDYGENVQRLAHKILKTGCVHFIASDVHGIKKRPIMLKEAYQFLSENFNENLAKLLMEENPKRLIQNEEIQNMIEDYYVENESKQTIKEKIRNFFRI